MGRTFAEWQTLVEVYQKCINYALQVIKLEAKIFNCPNNSTV